MIGIGTVRIGNDDEFAGRCPNARLQRRPVSLIGVVY